MAFVLLGRGSRIGFFLSIVICIRLLFRKIADSDQLEAFAVSKNRSSAKARIFPFSVSLRCKEQMHQQGEQTERCTSHHHTRPLVVFPCLCACKPLKNLDITICSIHADPLSVFDQLCYLLHSYNCRQAVFTGDDSSVGHQSTHFCYQSFNRNK